MNPYMQETGWGAIGTAAFDLAPANDRTTYIAPAQRYQAYAGTQLHNGVGQLTSSWMTGDNTPGALPYWQHQDRTNPPILIRGGGPALTPIAVMNVDEMKRPAVLRLRDVLATARRNR